jgi:hypothetical protein
MLDQKDSRSLKTIADCAVVAIVLIILACVLGFAGVCTQLATAEDAIDLTEPLDPPAKVEPELEPRAPMLFDFTYQTTPGVRDTLLVDPEKFVLLLPPEPPPIAWLEPDWCYGPPYCGITVAR